MIRHLSAIFTIFFLLSTTTSFSRNKDTDQQDPESLTRLIDLVINEEEISDTLEYFPEIISDIVKDYYSETVIPESTAIDVLNYVENVYSQHGYYENGDWAPKRSYTRYVPYKGDLPEYELKDFVMPVEGRLTSTFGYRPKFHRHHHGIDVALNMGDTVRCALPGIVTKTGYDNGGYGNYVVVSHAGELETLYAHLNHALAVIGQKMDAGTAVGIGGSTGNSTGPHLHFETRCLGVTVDPVSWFSIAISR